MKGDILFVGEVGMPTIIGELLCLIGEEGGGGERKVLRRRSERGV